MPPLHVKTIREANRLFLVASKKANPKPTAAQRKAIVTRLVREVQRPPQTLEGRKSVLIRLGKYLKLPAYRAYLMAGLVASGGIAAIGYGGLTMARDPQVRKYADWFNWFGRATNKPTTAKLDIAILLGALQMTFGAAVGGHAVKGLVSTYATGN